MATHSSILAWRIPWQRNLADYSLWGRKELDRTEQLSTHSLFTIFCQFQVYCKVNLLYINIYSVFLRFFSHYREVSRAPVGYNRFLQRNLSNSSLE